MISKVIWEKLSAMWAMGSWYRVCRGLPMCPWSVPNLGWSTMPALPSKSAQPRLESNSSLKRFAALSREAWDHLRRPTLDPLLLPPHPAAKTQREVHPAGTGAWIPSVFVPLFIRQQIWKYNEIYIYMRIRHDQTQVSSHIINQLESNGIK